MENPSKLGNRRKARFTIEQAHAIRSITMGLLYAAAGLFILFVNYALPFVKDTARIALVVILELYGLFRLYRGISAMNFIKRRLK